MKTQARVVVVGGGVVGASVLYHLTKNGWQDVVLLERNELTSGSTWHAAGGMHTLNGDPNVAKLQQYTIELYREIEQLSGQNCGIHLTGGVMLADTEERMDWLRMAHARGRYLGMETEMISAQEAKRRLPILEPKYFVGAMYDRHEGHVDPSGVTHAFAKVARNNGATIQRNTWARSITRAADVGWLVDTVDTPSGNDKGTLHCEHVVNAGGLWAREVGRMVGIELPVLAMEHMYLLTEDLQVVADYNAEHGEMLHAIDFGGEIYMRQERGGLLLGTYERNGTPWSPDETPWDFNMQLLNPDLERIAESLQVGFDHFPVFADAGIRQMINGPFTFSPDGNPLVGPVRGLPGYWTACAVMAGLSQGGGVGLALANWMTSGDPGFDIWGMDVARFGDFATRRYTNAKVRENYSRRFQITFPNEVLPGARPLKTSPIYDRLVSENAVWGVSFGLEVPLWFQSHELEPVENVTFTRSNAWQRVQRETLAVRNGVGMMETTAFAKFLVEGPGAREYLDSIVTNTVPAPGRLALAPMVNANGKLIGDLTVACLPAASGTPTGSLTTVIAGATANTVGGSERFILFGSGIAERYYERWFDQHMASHASVTVTALGHELCGLSIAGPQSRELLSRLTHRDVSAGAFRFMDFRQLDLKLATTWCGRISFTGDLGFELWMPASEQRYVYDLLRKAGADLDLTLFGLRALDSLRLEKAYGSWAREYRPLYDPFEAGLGRFVQLDKNYVGRDALVLAKARGPERRLLCWSVKTGTGDEAADVIGDEPVWHEGKVVGWITSGGYAHHSGASVAMGYVPAALQASDGDFDIEILGKRRPATLINGCLWDPDGRAMRG